MHAVAMARVGVWCVVLLVGCASARPAPSCRDDGSWQAKPDAAPSPRPAAAAPSFETYEPDARLSSDATLAAEDFEGDAAALEVRDAMLPRVEQIDEQEAWVLRAACIELYDTACVRAAQRRRWQLGLEPNAEPDGRFWEEMLAAEAARRDVLPGVANATAEAASVLYTSCVSLRDRACAVAAEARLRQLEHEELSREAAAASDRIDAHDIATLARRIRSRILPSIAAASLSDAINLKGACAQLGDFECQKAAASRLAVLKRRDMFDER